ncbi:MAG TPA: amidohydrolase family protein [bacterium]|nr:amidohydrolase family protein [bacterium]
MLLYAAALLNPGREPVLEPALWIRGDTLAYAGPCADMPDEAARDPDTLDLGEVVVCPGLVNAHAHLELTALQDLPYPGEFVGWIKSLMESKNRIEPRSQDEAFHQGILQCLRGGTTCIGDHVSVGANLEPLMRSPLRGRAFVEVIGVVPEVARDMLKAALHLQEIWRKVSPDLQVSPSPHSVHALSPDILAETLSLPEPVFSVHLAESQSEWDYFAKKAGTMHDFIASRGQALDREADSAVRELKKMGRLNGRLLAIHGNYLDAADLELLAQAGASLVHCPFSHGYFGHEPFPLKEARAAGLNIALGTDSLASASTLSMLEVMRAMEKEFPELKREEIFAMATINGARALKLDALCGTLEAGKKADLIAFPSAGLRPLEAIFQAENVEAILIGGRLVRPA